jgi:NAD kinase
VGCAEGQCEAWSSEVDRRDQLLECRQSQGLASERATLGALASHSLSARPLVMPMGSGVEFEVVEVGDMPHAYCVVDGQVQTRVAGGTRITMRPAEHRFRHLVQSPAQFFQVLVAKFGFAGMARQRGS